ncbi:putative phage protein (TIGR01671 family) [Staphylococcus hominis]
MIPKFRVWDKDHEYMEYTDKNLIVSFGDNGNVDVTDLSNIYSTCNSMQNFELMQATGVRYIYDESGQEIYEGDIVKTRTSEYGRFIGYVDNAISRFKVRGVKQYKGLSVDLDGTCEIIGNIYENPELLEDD